MALNGAFQKVKFDPSNSEHREAVHYFMTNRKWGDKNVFILEEEYTNMPDMVAEKLLQFYLKKEFQNG